MRWRTGTEAWLTLRPVAGFDGPPVVIELGEWTWPVVGVDRLRFDDPWMARVHEHLRQRYKGDDSPGRTA